MLPQIFDETKSDMERSLEALKKEFSTLRTGRVSAKIVDNIKVDYFGTATALSGVGSISSPDANTIMITPWDKSLLKEIEKAIQAANIGVNPSNNGAGVILSFPPMTQDQRKETAKQAKVMAEKAKVAVRNQRRDANDKVKKLEKDKAITEDESKKGQDQIQKITDDYIAKVDKALQEKETDILKV
ncbi:MAG: ribosome recycling factor [Campylobacterales bacterium]